MNADHPLTRNLLSIFQRNPEDEFLAMSAEQMFEGALLLEGYLEDPHQMVERTQQLLERPRVSYLARQGQTEE